MLSMYYILRGVGNNSITSPVVSFQISFIGTIPSTFTKILPFVSKNIVSKIRRLCDLLFWKNEELLSNRFFAPMKNKRMHADTTTAAIIPIRAGVSSKGVGGPELDFPV